MECDQRLDSVGAAIGADVPDPLSDEMLASSLPGEFRGGHARVNGTTLHYVCGGRGAPLVVLPGWPQTWWQARKILPILAGRYRVIAVDLRGMGGSGTPDAGYDKKTMAEDVYELVRQLGHEAVDLVGHDIGSMVAFSFAANHPRATRKLALLEEPHPDERLYELTLLPRPGQQARQRWWFAFNQVHGLPERLLADRSRLLIDYLCERNLRDPSAIDEQARTVYARAYARPEAIRAANRWYQAFGQDILDLRGYARLTMPVQAMYAQGHTDILRSLADTAANFHGVEIRDSGHYLAEERPEEVAQHLIEFFG